VDAFAIDSWTGNVRLHPRFAPSGIVTNWSCRNAWFVFVYAKNLNAGSTFQMAYGRRERVYLASEVPADNVSGLKPLDGLMLKRDVNAGDAIREGDFEETGSRRANH
jgi:flagella basal body P-ring formation protein FlgA